MGRCVCVSLRLCVHVCTCGRFSEDLIREWRRASKEEVDFLLEAKNATDASKALQKRGIDVVCPMPISEYCGKRVLTMVFIEGWKITDVDKMPYGTDRETMARNLVHAFAVLVFQEGLIHGDPHPGASQQQSSSATAMIIVIRAKELSHLVGAGRQGRVLPA